MTAGVGRRRRPWPVLLAVAAVLAVTVAAVTANGLALGSGSGSASRDTLPPATATVKRQTLVDTQTETGQLGYGEQTAVSGRLTGTVTALPAAGATINRGEGIYRVDNAAVLLLYGPLPAYRDLAVGSRGADVRQFEDNLNALGYRGFTVDDVYSATTAQAVKKWQKSLGLPQTGSVEWGRVVYAAGPVRVDERTVTVGTAIQPGEQMLTYTGLARLVTVELGVSEQRLVKDGVAVVVTLPDGRTSAGKIDRWQTVIKPAEGNNAAATKIRVTVSVDDETLLAGLDQATIGVGFTASRRENALTVPVAALLALAEGGYGVQVVDGTSTRIVAVQTGLFAGGRVEVSGDGLAEGLTVGVPS